MNAVAQSNANTQDAAAIFEWCADYIGNLLGTDPKRIRTSDSLDELGLDSASATSMVIEMENHLGIDVPVAMVFAEPTLGDIAQRVAESACAAAAQRAA